jgi:undecaprenyl-diphosphatase
VDASTILYGFLCAYLFTRETSAATRWLVAAISLAMVACVAVSRMYLGVHYLSDVAAAFAEGIAWLALCLAVRERLEVSGATRPDAKPAISPAPR